MSFYWAILRFGRDRWEETNQRARTRGQMETLVHRLQLTHPDEEIVSVAMPHEGAWFAVKLYDYQGDGQCWTEDCTRRPTYEAFARRPALVCSRHIQRYLREHVVLRLPVSPESSSPGS